MARNIHSKDFVSASPDLLHPLTSSARDCLAAIGKQSYPGSDGVFPRERLFRLLDEVKNGAVTLIHGPPGSGKTTLAASYVASRTALCLWYRVAAADQDLVRFFHCFGLLAAKFTGSKQNFPLPPSSLQLACDMVSFSRAYFRRLYGQLAQGFILVFDDYQEVSASASLHEILYGACLALPENGRILLLSRMGCPPVLSRIDGKDGLSRFGWDELQLTLDETRGVLQARGHASMPENALDRVHRRCGGWVAGLIQSIEPARETLELPRSGDTPQRSLPQDSFPSERILANGRCWPIQIYTLGRFAVLKDGEKLEWVGKAQHKPIELLKALVALGGREVAAVRLAEILWPDAEGDAAHHAFETTLHRLRKLLGCPEALVLHDGKLTLDANHVWVDVWLLQRYLSRLEEALQHVMRDRDILLPLKTRLLSLYQRPFLDGDQDQSWTLPLRDRLHQRLQQALERLGQYWESVGSWEMASECYQEGVRLDPCVELFYRNLMAGYLQRGHHAAAAAIYERCREHLAQGFGLAPSPAMQSLYLALPVRDGAQSPSLQAIGRVE